MKKIIEAISPFALLFAMFMAGVLVTDIYHTHFKRHAHDFHCGYELGAWHTMRHHVVTGDYPPMGWRYEAWKNDNGDLSLDDIMEIYYQAGWERGTPIRFEKFTAMPINADCEVSR